MTLSDGLHGLRKLWKTARQRTIPWQIDTPEMLKGRRTAYEEEKQNLMAIFSFSMHSTTGNISRIHPKGEKEGMRFNHTSEAHYVMMQRTIAAAGRHSADWSGLAYLEHYVDYDRSVTQILEAMGDRAKTIGDVSVLEAIVDQRTMYPERQRRLDTFYKDYADFVVEERASEDYRIDQMVIGEALYHLRVPTSGKAMHRLQPSDRFVM